MPENIGTGTWFGARLAANAAEAGSRTALVFEDRSWTYAELDLAVRRTLAVLADRGIRRGHRVVMRGEARPEALITLFAVTRMGAILVPVHPQLTGRELAVVCEDTEPRAIIAERSFLAGPPVDEDATLRLAWDDLQGDAVPPRPFEPPAGSDPAIIAFTSGTSGRPKGAVLTHDNLHWSMVNGMARVPVADGDTVLVATPLAHVAVLGGLPQYTWAHRGTVVLAPRFDADLFIDLVRDHHVTAAFAVPAMLTLLARHRRFGTADLDPLRWVLAGGSPAMSSTTSRLLDRGIKVVNSYGLTEASAGVTYAALDEVADRPTSAGRPVPHVELLVVDDQGAAAPVGTIGEIRLRGPSVTTSYWTASGPRPATDPEGWFHTGDRGRYDEQGRLEVVGRAKEMIITGGENIDPAEVENALLDLPGVAEAAVGGAPDPVWGEVVTAFLVTGGPGPTLDDVRRHLDGRLARHKWPRRLHIVPELPRGATGKLQRRALPRLAADPSADPSAAPSAVPSAAPCAAPSADRPGADTTGGHAAPASPLAPTSAPASAREPAPASAPTSAAASAREPASASAPTSAPASAVAPVPASAREPAPAAALAPAPASAVAPVPASAREPASASAPTSAPASPPAPAPAAAPAPASAPKERP